MPETGPPRLIADIGGTNARFALLDGGGGGPRAVRVLACGDHPDLAAAARAYLDATAPDPAPVRAAIAVASPVTGDAVAMTNRGWSFRISDLERTLGLDRLEVINDFAALALAAPALGANDVTRIGGGRPQPGWPIAVLGPGTGLGVSGLVPTGDGWIPLATEGGHATLAPADDRERALAAALAAQFGHVSIERAVSGPGLVNLYRALASRDGARAEDATPASIAGRALAGADPRCVEALDTFCAMLGTAAGNLALCLGARGGVYIGGGIVPRLGAAFAASPFRRRFEDKGRFRDYLRPIPAYVVTREHPALLGLEVLLDGAPGG